MKFKILKKFSKISNFSQIISCRHHWLWNHVICQDWWVKSIDFGVNSSKMGKLGKIKYFNELSTVNRKSHEGLEVLEHAQILWYSIRWFLKVDETFILIFTEKSLLKIIRKFSRLFILEGSKLTLWWYKMRYPFPWCLTFYIISSIRNFKSKIWKITVNLKWSPKITRHEAHNALFIETVLSVSKLDLFKTQKFPFHHFKKDP